MPPFSSGFAGSLGQGMLQGAVESQEKARKESADRETKALHTFTQLTGQGWTPLDKDKGSPTGEALFFPSLGQMLVPPTVDKTSQALFKLQEQAMRYNTSLVDYNAKLEELESKKQHGQSVQAHDAATLKKLEVEQETARVHLQKAREKDLGGDKPDYQYDMYGFSHGVQYPKQPGGPYVIDGKPYMLRSLNDWVPPGKTAPGLSETPPMMDITIPDPKDPKKKQRVSVPRGTAQEWVDLGRAVMGTPVSEAGEGSIPATAHAEKLLDLKGKFLNWNKDTQRFTMKSLPPNEEKMLSQATSNYGWQTTKIPLGVVPPWRIPVIGTEIGGTQSTEPEAVYIITVPGVKPTKADVVKELTTYYGYSPEDAAKRVYGVKK